MFDEDVDFAEYALYERVNEQEFDYDDAKNILDLLLKEDFLMGDCYDYCQGIDDDV